MYGYRVDVVYLCRFDFASGVADLAGVAVPFEDLGSDFAPLSTVGVRHTGRIRS